MIRQILEQSARILGAPRVLLAWEEEGEPWLHLASLAGGEFQYTREPPAVFGGVVAEPLTCTSFFCPDTRCLSPKVIPKSPAGLQGWTGAPLHPGLQTRFAVNSVLSLTLNGGNLKGYLLALDKPRMTSDDLVLGEIVANKAAARLDRFYLLRQLQQAADAEERIRLARDLHDGLLQSLTAAALQLETVNRLMEENTQEAARQRLMEIQQLIAAEQKDLRFHIRQLKPSSANLPDGDSSLEARLGELAGRIERHWGLRVQMNIKHLGQKIPRALEQEIYFLVHESLINAARHAQAPTVRAELGVEDNRVYIYVADDGRGFPFRGRYDHVTLAKMNLGPATLKERIAALGGSLAIESSDSGACLEISIPLRGIGDEDAHSPHIG